MFGSSARKAVAGLVVGLILGTSVAAQTGAWTLVGNVLTYRANVAASNPAVRMRNDGSGAIAAFNYAGTDRFLFYQTYLNMSSTLGSSGYGIRNNSGVVEVKSSGGAWAPVATTNIPSTSCYGWNSDTYLQRLAAGVVGVSTTCDQTTFAGTLKAAVIATADGTAAAPSYSFASEATTGFYRASTNDLRVSVAGADVWRSVGDAVVLSANNYIGWGSSGVASADTKLYRDAANTLALRNGTNGQSFRVYGSYTDSGNYNRAILIASAAGDAYVGTQNAGTGVTTHLHLMTGNSARWSILGSTGHFVASTDNTYDIGASGANRPRTGYFGTRVVSPEFQTTTALVALGGGAGATLGTIGGSGPATAGQNTWLRMVDSTGAAFWVPAWK